MKIVVHRTHIEPICLVLPRSLDFWPTYASERLQNYLRKQVLEPNRAVLVPPSPCLSNSLGFCLFICFLISFPATNGFM